MGRKDTFTHLLSSPALGQGLSSPQPGTTSQLKEFNFPATEEGTGGQRHGKVCPGDTAGELRAAVKCLELPEPVPVIKVVLVTTCWNLAQQQECRGAWRGMLRPRRL